MDQSGYYAQLEEGARHLAANSGNAEERRLHLGWANRYYRLKIDSLQTQAPTTAVAA